MTSVIVSEHGRRLWRVLCGGLAADVAEHERQVAEKSRQWHAVDVVDESRIRPAGGRVGGGPAVTIEGGKS